MHASLLSRLMRRALIMPGFLVVATVGPILSGLARPTEGAGVVAFGAAVSVVVTGRFKMRIRKESLYETLKPSGRIAWMISGAGAFNPVFAAIGGNRMIVSIAMNMPGGAWGAQFVAIVCIFFPGMLLETMANIMLAAPILSPIIVTPGFDPLWWAIIFMTLPQSASIAPPFGVALF